MKDNLGKMFDRKSTSKVKETKECQLPALLFKAKNDAHISHLLQQDKTLARHNAFSYFYTTIGDRIDGFVETYMAMNTLTSIVVPESSVIEEPISYFQDLYNQIQKVRKEHKQPYLLAQLDVIDEIIMQTLYMFKYIQT